MSPGTPHACLPAPRASPAPRHLKGLPQRQREDTGHLLLAPAASLEGVAHHGGTGESGLDVEGDVPCLRQEVDLKPGGRHAVVRAAGGWGGTPPQAAEGPWEALSLTCLLQRQYVPGPADSSPGPGPLHRRLQTAGQQGGQRPGVREGPAQPAHPSTGSPQDPDPGRCVPSKMGWRGSQHGGLMGGWLCGEGAQVTWGAPAGPDPSPRIQASLTCSAISPASADWQSEPQNIGGGLGGAPSPTP